ncbi:type II CRISPR-associated endonuclease Cas1 [Schaalia turicensis]|uniref:type II CRISPR-associated endonuclease Cas1 n=1 Tax=Schaalia turicensis TaxID=131111 RepID=UPI0034A284C2
MSSQWRILDFTSFEGKLHSDDGAIVVVNSDGVSQRISVADVAVVLIGMKVSFSAGVIHRLTDKDIAVLFCDWRGVPESGAFSWSEHTRVGARHKAQLELSLPRRKNAWGRIVRSKIQGQAAVLRNLNRPGARELERIAGQVRSGDPSNLEGQAARIYWSKFSDTLGKRTPGIGALFGPNSCLDYGYAILRGHGIRAVLAAGLGPANGVFHRGRSNMFNLVDDLIEPFRPCIDEIAMFLPADATPSDRSVKKRLVAAAMQTFSDDGSVPRVLLDLAQQYGRYVEGDIEKLPVPSWQGPSALNTDLKNA